MPTDDHSDTFEIVTFPVESPLMVTYHQETGMLTIDSAILQNAEGPSEVFLRLNFSADAAYRFISLLREVEDQLSISMEGQRLPIVLQ